MARKEEPVDFQVLSENIHDLSPKSPVAEQEIMLSFKDFIILVEEKKIEEFVDHSLNKFSHQILGKEPDASYKN